MKRHRWGAVAVLAFLLAGFGRLPQIVKAADGPGPDAIFRLLGVAKAQSYTISVDAGLLRSYTQQSSLDWRTHAKQINRMKDHINAAAKTVVALDGARSQAAPWQLVAIDRILPYMKEIAEDTTNAIDYLNKNQSRLSDKQYKEYLEANSDMSRELAGLIAQFVDYGNSKGMNDKLQKKLELPSK